MLIRNTDKEISFICLLVKQDLCLIELVERLSTLALVNELPEEEKESSSKQEEEVLIAKSQPLQSQDLAINPEPPISQNLPREEGIPPLEIPIKIKDDLFDADFGRTLNKRPSSEYNSNPLKKGSLRKRLKSNSFGGHLEKLKGGVDTS